MPNPTCILICLLCLFTCVQAKAEEPKKAEQKELQKRIVDHWMKVSRDHAKSYTITADQGKQVFSLYKHPVLQHIQIVRGNDIGAVHLWLDKDARPAAIATVFAWTTSDSTRMVFNELHSLADVPIRATQDGKAFWQSKIPGTEWNPVPDAPMPAEAPRLRQIQAKQLAKKFSSHMFDNERKRWELRLLTTPIYEYDIKSDAKRGGAVFAFNRGTDLETILFLEVRGSKRKPQWEFTCAKFTDYEPHMVYKKQDVWKPIADRYMQDGNPHYWAPVGTREMPDFEVASRTSK